jgi:hypothetical protein
MDQQWAAYNVAVGDHTLPTSTKTQVIPYKTTSSEKGITGFQDLTPANPQIQARYDAMSPEWEGITASNNYVFNNIAKSQSAPATQK